MWIISSYFRIRILPSETGINILKFKNEKMKQALTRLFPLMLAMSITGIFTGCNNSAEEKKTTDTTTATTENTVGDTSKQGATTTTFRFPTVIMTKENFNTVFSTTRSGQVVMVYFQYYNTGSGTWDFNRLQAYGANDNGEDMNNPIDLAVDPRGPTLDFDMQKPYEQQITIGNLRTYLGINNGSTTPVSANTYPNVWLVPCVTKDSDGNELLYYRITAAGTAPGECPDATQPNQTGRMSSNPSPPGRPCYDECGEGQIMKKYKKSELDEFIDTHKTN
jgi:hypothetical protein